MKKAIMAFTAFLICLPLATLFYKSQVLNLSILPQMVDDVWNFHLAVRPKGEHTSFSFPIPRPSSSMKITDEKIRSKDFEVFLDTSSDSTIATWSAKEPIKRRVTYSARIDLKPLVIKTIPKDYTEEYPKGLEKFLMVPKLIPEDEEAIKTLESAILEGTEDKTSVVRKIYYYIEEEIQRNTDIRTIHETLGTGKGSPLVKAKLFNIMARRKSVPSRIVVMLRMPEKSEQADKAKLKLTFANEVFLAGRWVPIDTNRGYFGERPDRFMVLHHDYEEVGRMISKNTSSYAIHAERARINRYNKAEFKREIIQSDSIFSKFSLYRLPLPLQNMFTTILLIPVGTLVLALARNIIGIPTFGIFTPILLTLFFKETSFGFGLLFFLLDLRLRNALHRLEETLKGFVLVVNRVEPIGVHCTDKAEVEKERERRDDREIPVDRVGDSALDREGDLGLRLRRRRRDELEENGRLADDDAAARVFPEADLVHVAVLLRGAPQRRKVGDTRRQREPAGHAVDEVERVIRARELEEREPLGEELGADRERRLLARADGHRAALLDDALLDDASALGDDANAEHFRAILSLDGSHHGGHLTGTTRALSSRGRLRHARIPPNIQRPLGERVYIKCGTGREIRRVGLRFLGVDPVEQLHVGGTVLVERTNRRTMYGRERARRREAEADTREPLPERSLEVEGARPTATCDTQPHAPRRSAKARRRCDSCTRTKLAHRRPEQMMKRAVRLREPESSGSC